MAINVEMDAKLGGKLLEVVLPRDRLIGDRLVGDMELRSRPAMATAEFTRSS